MSSAVQKFTVTGAAGSLEGVVHLPNAPARALAVVCHPLPTMGGTMENKVAFTLARTFQELDCVALRFNFRGVGSSEGEFAGGNGEVEDALAVAEFGREQFGDLPLILSGFSFGGYVAARAAQMLPPRHLILVAPAVGRFAMPPVTADTLVIHGEHDDVVPLGAAFEWARPQHLPIVVLPQADHYFHGRLAQLRDLVKQHFLGTSL